MTQRPLGSFPLSGCHVAKLSSAGFETSGDLRDVGVVELSKGITRNAVRVVFSNKRTLLS